jgi:two-component sensor histidine kinase
MPATASASSCARTYTQLVLLDWDLPDQAESLVLVVSELVTNVTRHVADVSDGLELRLASDADTVRIEVWDGDPRPPVPRAPGEQDESGFGFVLIEALTEKWGVEIKPAGKVVWAEIRID